MEPFVTTKEDGSGLGLLSVKACAEAYQGRVDISESKLGGACFAIQLKNSPSKQAG
jgi:C4-dicarboxylate-specific signal transduction histidine kinase